MVVDDVLDVVVYAEKVIDTCALSSDVCGLSETTTSQVKVVVLVAQPAPAPLSLGTMKKFWVKLPELGTVNAVPRATLMSQCDSVVG